MPEFTTSAFAVAGLIAAAGPVIIHLLNRRRFRVVEWAAMDFLREALQRNRKILQLRDLILLALRTACVLLFGLALAQPHWRDQGGSLNKRGPLHAVVILDNSQSMGFSKLDGTLLDEAKQKAEEFLVQLPTGSRVSVVPLCGADSAYTLEPHRSKEDAREAIRRIQVVDRSGSAAQAADLALEACQLAPDLPAKRVIFLGDQQVGNWPSGGMTEQLGKLPEMQVVHIGPDGSENAWISSFRVQDGIADIESPTAFYATVRYEGPAPKSNVQISLEVDGSSVASRNIDLEPGQSREVQFPHRFDVPTEPGKATFVTASVKLHEDTIPGDRLASDNQRFAVVPVVAALPVVFIDQFGEKEDPGRGDYGETFHLRRLLAPVTSRGDHQRQLVQVRHVTVDSVNKQLLEDARLVVLSGVSSPGLAVPILREYVQQGGQLVITAGGQFDPKAWTDSAWLDGAGILPAPLNSELYGKSPEESAGALAPFQLDTNSLVHDYFRLEDASDEELSDLYQVPVFFKAVVADLGVTALEELSKTETKRISEEQAFLESARQRSAEWARRESQGILDAETQQLRQQDESRMAEIRPTWLLWNLQESDDSSVKTVADLVQAGQPRVLAKFTDEQKLPFLIERKIGKGQVLLFTTSVFSDWNDLTKTNAALVFDRIFRFLLQDTLPRRTVESIEQFTLPVETGDRRITYSLMRPGQTQSEVLNVDALGGDSFGVTIRNMTRAGTYLISASRAVESTSVGSQMSEPEKLWDVPLALNGPERESELSSIDPAELKKRLGAANYRWIERDEPISLEGAQISFQGLWKWLMWFVLLALLLELVIVAWPQIKKGGQA